MKYCGSSVAVTDRQS